MRKREGATSDPLCAQSAHVRKVLARCAVEDHSSSLPGVERSKNMQYIGSMKYLLVAFVMALLVGLPSMSLAATATESVKGTIDKVLHILQDKEMKKADRTE
jgi:hypothetical protein